MHQPTIVGGGLAGLEHLLDLGYAAGASARADLGRGCHRTSLDGFAARIRPQGLNTARTMVTSRAVGDTIGGKIRSPHRQGRRLRGHKPPGLLGGVGHLGARATRTSPVRTRFGSA
jgi:hypothetical protein